MKLLHVKKTAVFKKYIFIPAEAVSEKMLKTMERPYLKYCINFYLQF
jgi:hypothetical protein